VEAGGAADEGHAPLGADAGSRHAGPRRGEVDHHLRAPIQRTAEVGLHGDAEPVGRLRGPPTGAGPPDDLHLRIGSQAEDLLAHPARDADDHRSHHRTSMPRAESEARRASRVEAVAGVSGRRISSWKRPIRWSAAFTGMGLDSRKSARCSGFRRTWRSRAFSRSPSIDARMRSEKSLGATLAETLITPRPPHAMKGSTVKSSPERRTKRSPTFSRMSITRCMLAVASLTATISSISARAV